MHNSGNYDPGRDHQNRIDRILRKYARLWGMTAFVSTFVGLFLLTVESDNGLTFMDALMFSAFVGAITWVVCEH